MAQTKKQSSADDAGRAEVQERMDEATEQGYIGSKVDPTPNEEYSLEKPSFKTPETDAKAAAAARESVGLGKLPAEQEQEA